MTLTQRAAWILALAVLSVGCDKKPDDKDSDKKAEKKSDEKSDKKKDDKGESKAKDSDKPKVEEKTKKDKVALVDLDMSTRGPEWKGYSIKAPVGSKVMEDMSNARVAGKGCPITDDDCSEFDIILSLDKPDFKAKKKANMDSIAALDAGKDTYTKDTDEMLEWTSEMGSSKFYNFAHAIKVGTQVVVCSSLHGATKEADIKTMMEACKTLAKK